MHVLETTFVVSSVRVFVLLCAALGTITSETGVCSNWRAHTHHRIAPAVSSHEPCNHAAGLNSSNSSVTVLSSFGALAPCTRQHPMSGERGTATAATRGDAQQLAAGEAR